MRKLLLLLLFVSATLSIAQTPRSRHFVFDYSFTVKVTDPGKPLDVWFPMAHSDQFQQINVIEKEGDLPLKQTSESEYGNKFFYAHTDKADKPEYHFTVKYDVVRTEHLAAASVKETATQRELNRFLQPDTLVPITGKPAEIAREQVKSGMSEMEKAQALYSYVFNTMRYDKSGTGWGHGDTLWACDSKRGNCTDFHSVFISMARSQSIPARFEIGFSIPEDKATSDIGGYHCWAEFYTQKTGWYPVDISEAWKHQEKKDYFFGAHDVNRMQFTLGRDLELSPRQHGERLNYMVYPYAELGGQSWPNIAIAFSFRDADAHARSAAR